jgi:hypothetical protein
MVVLFRADSSTFATSEFHNHNSSRLNLKWEKARVPGVPATLAVVKRANSWAQNGSEPAVSEDFWVLEKLERAMRFELTTPTLANRESPCPYIGLDSTPVTPNTPEFTTGRAL